MFETVRSYQLKKRLLLNAHVDDFPAERVEVVRLRLDVDHGGIGSGVLGEALGEHVRQLSGNEIATEQGDRRPVRQVDLRALCHLRIWVDTRVIYLSGLTIAYTCKRR